MPDRAEPGRAEFVTRRQCIACQSEDLVTLASGKFTDDPVRRFIAEDPWGVSPLPYLDGQTWEYRRCNACGQLFHGRLLTPEWQEVRFREWMSAEAIRRFEQDKQLNTPPALFGRGVALAKHVLRIERMTRAVRGPAAVRVLDFGCGWGEFLVMATLFGFDACGVERSPDRQKHLRDRGVTTFADLAAAVAAVGPNYHAATLFQVLEHLDDPLAVLRALHAVLVPGAVLVVEVPNCEGITGIETRADYYNIHPLEHINCFTPDSLRKMAARAGFTAETKAVVQVTGSPLGVIKGEARRWAQRVMSPDTNQYFRRA